MNDAALLFGRAALATVLLVSRWDKFVGTIDGFAGSLANKGMPLAGLMHRLPPRN